ncbi:MAG: BrnT family toxin [Pontiella sp.]
MSYSVVMDKVKFEWDESKNRSNQKKHGVSFGEAQTVFFDDRAIEFYDDEHSEWEDRFLMLGYSFKHSILMLCYCTP